MAGLVVAGLTTWQYEGTTAKKKHEHRISYLTGGGLLMEGLEACPTLCTMAWACEWWRRSWRRARGRCACRIRWRQCGRATVGTAPRPPVACGPWRFRFAEAR